MRQNKQLLSFRDSRRWLLFAAVISFCLVGLNSQRTNAQQQPAGSNNANSSTQKPRTKRLTPLRSSDTADGSRVTITSDGELNDYSAYRSGDRFIVVVPQAEGAGGGGVRGRGFEGAQVERRGKDLVYTFKLQPGATARVNQRFNRLDVQFNAPRDATTAKNSNNASPAATPTPATPANQQRTKQPGETAVKPVTTAGAQPTPGASRAPEAAANNTTPNNVPPTVTQSPSTATLTPVETPRGAVSSPTLAPTATPLTDEQLARAQTTPQAPVSITTNAPTTTSFGAAVIRNWPWLIAALLVAGIGLLFVARFSERREARSLPPAPPVKQTVTVKETKTPELKPSAAAPAPISSSPASTTAATAVPAATATNLPAFSKQSKKKKKRGWQAKDATAAGESKTGGATTKDASAVIAATGAAIAAGGATKAEESKPVEPKAVEPESVAAQATEPKAVAPPIAFDPAGIEVEIKKLLAGESSDESIINPTDASTRQLVSAELMSAIAGRNAERKERALAAFHQHGYFNEATRALQSAEAPAERASAARTLGLVGDQSATPHLIAALEDPAADVRRTTVESLAELQDPAAVGALEALRWRETSRQVPRSLIQRAIEASKVVEAEAASVDAAAPARVTATDALAPAEAEASVMKEPEAQEAQAQAPETKEPPAQELELLLATPVATTETVETTQESPVLSATETATPEVSAAVEDEVTVETQAIDVEATAVVVEATAVGAETRAVEVVAVETATPEAEPAATGIETDLASTLADKELTLIKAREMEEDRQEADANLMPSPTASTASPVERNVSAERAIEMLTADTRPLPPAVVSDAPAGAKAGSEEVAAESVAESHPIYISDFAVGSGTQPDVNAENWIDLNLEARAVTSPATKPAVSHPTPAEPLGPFYAESAGEWSPVETPEEPPALPVVETNAPESITLFEPLEVEAFETDAAHTPLVEATPVDIASDVASFEDAPTRPLVAENLSIVEDAPRGTGVVKADQSITVAGEFADEDLSIIPKGIQVRLASEDVGERAESVLALARLNTDEAFGEICAAFDDPDSEVRNAAARALYDISEDRADSFTRALRESAPKRRREIGAALSDSGLAAEAISNLTGESRDKTYDAFSLLFLMAKAGEVAPLIHAIESHPDSEVRLAVVKLLALSGQHDILPSFRRLAVRGSLPTEVRSAVMEAIYQISSTPAPDTTHAT